MVLCLVSGFSVLFLISKINYRTFISSEERRTNLYFLISLFPVSTVCCLVGMYSPRTAVLLSSFGLLYFLTCLFVLVSLIRHLSQGRDKFAQQLSDNQKLMRFQSPPFCCCMFFLPTAQPTECVRFFKQKFAFAFFQGKFDQTWVECASSANCSCFNCFRAGDCGCRGTRKRVKVCCFESLNF